MKSIETKINVVMRCLTATSETEREDALAELRGLLDGSIKPKVTTDVDAVIRQILLDLGVPDHLKGHPYLVMAIEAVTKDNDLLGAITSELYPSVAEKFKTTPSRVERAIRHAIECGWDRGDLEITSHYFGNTVSIDKGKPTNGEFIARVANVVRARLKGVA